MWFGGEWAGPGRSGEAPGRRSARRGAARRAATIPCESASTATSGSQPPTSPAFPKAASRGWYGQARRRRVVEHRADVAAHLVADRPGAEHLAEVRYLQFLAERAARRAGSQSALSRRRGCGSRAAARLLRQLPRPQAGRRGDASRGPWRSQPGWSLRQSPGCCEPRRSARRLRCCRPRPGPGRVAAAAPQRRVEAAPRWGPRRRSARPARGTVGELTTARTRKSAAAMATRPRLEPTRRRCQPISAR